MVSEDSMKRLDEYKAKLMKGGENHSSEQLAIDSLSLYLLGGDIEKLKQYKKAAIEMSNISFHQVSIDSLTLLLMENFPIEK